MTTFLNLMKRSVKVVFCPSPPTPTPPPSPIPLDGRCIVYWLSRLGHCEPPGRDTITITNQRAFGVPTHLVGRDVGNVSIRQVHFKVYWPGTHIA